MLATAWESYEALHSDEPDVVTKEREKLQETALPARYGLKLEPKPQALARARLATTVKNREPKRPTPVGPDSRLQEPERSTCEA